MKRLFLLFSLLLLLTACSTRQAPSASQAAQRALQQQGEDEYIVADADFVATNFGNADYLKNAVVYLSATGDGREFGFFELTDPKYREPMLAAVRDYLASEEQSVKALAALYPADELETRLRRFAHANVGTDGNLVYYTLTDE